MRATNSYKDATGGLEANPHDGAVIAFRGCPEIIPSDETSGPIDPSTAKRLSVPNKARKLVP
jgi:hypothetical protein